MSPDRIRSCLTHGLAVFWANQGYTCSIDGDRMLVTWRKGTLAENCVGLEGNHDPAGFFPDPEQIHHVVDTDYKEYGHRPSLINKQARLLKFRNGEQERWVAVLSPDHTTLPSWEAASDVALDLLDTQGFTPEHCLVVI